MFHDMQVTASGDTSLCLWDVVSGSLLTTFKAHHGSVKSVEVKQEEPCKLLHPSLLLSSELLNICGSLFTFLQLSLFLVAVMERY